VPAVTGTTTEPCAIAPLGKVAATVSVMLPEATPVRIVVSPVTSGFGEATVATVTSEDVQTGMTPAGIVEPAGSGVAENVPVPSAAIVAGEIDIFVFVSILGICKTVGVLRDSHGSLIRTRIN
jgi:hypothetical protein